MQIKTKIVSCHIAGPKPVTQEVNGTVILPPLVFPGLHYSTRSLQHDLLQHLRIVQIMLRALLHAVYMHYTLNKTDLAYKKSELAHSKLF